MRSINKKAMLLVLGLIIGSAGVSGYRKYAPMLPLGPFALPLSGDHFASACMTEQVGNGDPILFISCGGIY